MELSHHIRVRGEVLWQFDLVAALNWQEDSVAASLVYVEQRLLRIEFDAEILEEILRHGHNGAVFQLERARGWRHLVGHPINLVGLRGLRFAGTDHGLALLLGV